MGLFTIGIEEEFQTIDPVTRELKSHMSQLVEGGKLILQERIKQEMHQSVVEIGTNICQNITQARDEVTYLRKMLFDLADKQALKVAAAGTHPFSDWQHQLITPHEHYDKLVDEMRDVARGNLIFGLHVHIGIDDRNEAIQIMNDIRQFLPFIFALSTNSPFWCGRNTGFKSYRSKIFDKFPRTGLPTYFKDAATYDDYVNLLIKTNCIDNARKIWWDVRLHATYPTLEIRICDQPMRIDETICLAAVIQALVARIHQLHKEKQLFKPYRRLLIAENKWRAARYGTEASLIDFDKETEISFANLAQTFIEFLGDVPDKLNSRSEVDYLNKIVKNGTGADRQMAKYLEKRNLEAVVDYIIEETRVGI